MKNPYALLAVLAAFLSGCSADKNVDYFMTHPEKTASTLERCGSQTETDPKVCEAARSAQIKIAENAYQNALATFKSKDWLEQEQILQDRRCDANDYPGTNLNECKAFRVAYRQKIEEFDAQYRGKSSDELKALREAFCKAEAERYKDRRPYFSDCNLLGRLIHGTAGAEHAALSSETSGSGKKDAQGHAR